jgi:hypothetical protein
MFLKVLPSRKGRNNKQPDSDTKHTICDIKRRPVPARPVRDFDKVPHPAIIKNPVPEIAADAGGKQTQSDVNQSLPGSAEKENRKDYY